MLHKAEPPKRPLPRASRLLGAEAKPTTGRFALKSRVAFGVFVAVLLVGGCGAWAATNKLSGAVIAPGVLRVDEHVKVVQHRDGGIVTEIAVQEGDTVEAGQIIIRLDGVQARAELAIVKSQLAELVGRRARLVAQRDGLDAIDFPSNYMTEFAEATLIAAGERQLFDGERQNRSRLKEQLTLQLQQLDQEAAGLDAQLSALNDEIGLVETELTKIEELAADGLIEGSRVYSMNREITRMLGQQGEVEASRARAAVKASEIQLQILGVDETAYTEAQRELRNVETSIAELMERRTATEDRLGRIDIRAPIAGIVNELNIHTVGGIVSPAETLATIVPNFADLKVEVRLRTIDVDQIALGQQATLRFSAFNQRTTPEVEGRVVHVSAAAQHDARTGESFYVGDIEIVGDLEGIGRQSLLPGMPVEVFVETEEVTAISYLVKPFTDQVARAFREE